MDFSLWTNPFADLREKTYKPPPPPMIPIPDPFPLLSQNPPPEKSLLRAPRTSRPPPRRWRFEMAAGGPPPLFVGFTRNWPQLLQCVVSYIAAGWPAEDIYVVENTGVMFANREGKLTLQNPFYLNHTQLAMLGVRVIITPTLLTFSQLQNFYLWTALERSHPYFFWTHQDLLVFSHENSTSAPYNSLYTNAIRTLRDLTTTTPSSFSHSPKKIEPPPQKEEQKQKWAHHFFAYDHLTLVNRDAVLSVGGWDTQIPYYASDCDTYLRLMWAGFSQRESTIGLILDVGSVLADVGALLRIKGIKASLLLPTPGIRPEDEEGQDEKKDEDAKGEEEKIDENYVESWETLVQLGMKMEEDKYVGGNAGRNMWQAMQRGGRGEPFYRDADGFEKGVKMWIDAGRAVFAEKWGHRGCGLISMGIKGEDAWRLERDWDEETEGFGWEGNGW
ncbi:hypothetical protein N657DRAFT_622236 [Parathielavia appendiculata]|uniref:Uncharacterized protein n=1 Tax=Parathielavia appendiculata TaxID=2587402 RepID=A0AAN6TW42_9PEZI|nr:hypothetical protein N657DRAFT_622236 [Parathielavia appendiculata]